jgi:hypothetical protein
MLTLATLASMVMSAHAQMGWTLDQCRRHFGQEFLPAEGDNHYFHVGPTGTGKGEHVYIRLDPDGTVGNIAWLKMDGKAFSESEIQKHLKDASRVAWLRNSNSEEGQLHWSGYQNGKAIFEANEGNNGRGIWVLTISTKQTSHTQTQNPLVHCSIEF